MNTNSDAFKIRISEKDFKEYEDRFVIYNVPIAAELVQPYSDGLAFKPREELQKISVNNIPLTMRKDYPGHPNNFLNESESDFVAEQVVGFMREPSKKNKKFDERKKYADFILFKNDLTTLVIDAYKSGKIIDTSIGFCFDKQETTGTYEGVAYDYVQTNIVLDHNAILMDSDGDIGYGRMPSPIGGIGADSLDINLNGGNKMSEELKKEIDSIKNELETIKQEKDSINAEKDSLKQALDESTKANDLLKEELKKVQDEVDSFKAEKKAEIDSMRKTLVDSNVEYAKLFESANDDLIKEYHKKMLEVKHVSRDVGADMMGTGVNKKNVDLSERTKKWVSGKQK